MKKEVLYIIAVLSLSLCACGQNTEDSVSLLTTETSQDAATKDPAIEDLAIEDLTIEDSEGSTKEDSAAAQEKTEEKQEKMTLAVLKELVSSEQVSTTDYTRYDNGKMNLIDDTILNYYIEFPFTVTGDVITLKVSLMKEDDSLDRIYLFRESNEDMFLIWANNADGTVQNCTLDEMEAFLSYKYDINDDISFTVPEGLVPGDYSENDGFAGGCLLTPYAYEGSTSAPDCWKAAGMVGRFRADGIIEWDGGNIATVYSYWNHSVMENIGIVEDLCMPGYLVKGNHDLYTAVEQYELEEKGVSLENTELTSDYWYVFMAQPEEEFGYVISLNAKNYTMEDAIAFAKSVELR